MNASSARHEWIGNFQAGWLAVGLVFSVVLPLRTAEPIEVRSLPFAHAHNDYDHPRALFDALDQGFGNVEADVWLVNDQLLVAHDLDKTDLARTLQKLYLDPLRERVAKNRGSVFGDGQPFTLMIDFKSDATNTYIALRRLLQDFEPLLTKFHSNRTERGAVTIVISGNRPRSLMESEPVRLAGYDARLADLERPLSKHFAPWVSDNWRNVFKWDGTGAMPESEREHLRDLVNKARRRGLRLRFWGAPDTPAVWSELMSAHVDLINTDRLKEFRDFVIKR